MVAGLRTVSLSPSRVKKKYMNTQEDNATSLIFFTTSSTFQLPTFRTSQGSQSDLDNNQGENNPKNIISANAFNKTSLHQGPPATVIDKLTTIVSNTSEAGISPTTLNSSLILDRKQTENTQQNPFYKKTPTTDTLLNNNVTREEYNATTTSVNTNITTKLWTFTLNNSSHKETFNIYYPSDMTLSRINNTQDIIIFPTKEGPSESQATNGKTHTDNRVPGITGDLSRTGRPCYRVCQ
ncbi:hypothetical protein SK128_007607, partial [Halocaridina rubra]